MDPGRYVLQQGWDTNSVIVVSSLITCPGNIHHLWLMWLFSVFSGITIKNNQETLSMRMWMDLYPLWFFLADLTCSVNPQALEGYGSVLEPDFRWEHPHAAFFESLVCILGILPPGRWFWFYRLVLSRHVRYPVKIFLSSLIGMTVGYVCFLPTY